MTRTEWRFSAPPYCLHDARLCGIDIQGDTLTLRFEYGYTHPGGEPYQANGYIELHGYKARYSCVYTMRCTEGLCGNMGRFEGIKQSVEDFLTAHPTLRFDILGEHYDINCLSLSGILSEGRECLECIIELHCQDGIVYCTMP